MTTTLKFKETQQAGVELLFMRIRKAVDVLVHREVDKRPALLRDSGYKPNLNSFILTPKWRIVEPVPAVWVQGGFFGKSRFCRDSRVSSLEHKGTAFDASGRAPPASHGRPKGVARALRARGIVRSRIQKVFVVPNRIALQKKSPLHPPLAIGIYRTRQDAYRCWKKGEQKRGTEKGNRKGEQV
jgi:hypothetical protein